MAKTLIELLREGAIGVSFLKEFNKSVLTHVADALFSTSLSISYPSFIHFVKRFLKML